MTIKKIDAEHLQKLLRYDPETGRFFWRMSRPKCRVGAEAGSVLKTRSCTYLRVVIDTRRYQAHRLAWLYMTGEWPSVDIDHIDCNGLNNRWTNLRAATRTENLRNSQLRSDNISGYKGVSYNSARGRWISCIKVGDKNLHLGRFDTPEEAHAAYRVAAEKHFGEFARFA